MSSHLSEAGQSPADPGTSSSPPSRARSAQRRGTVVCTGYTHTTALTSHPEPCRPNCSPPPRPSKSSPAPSSRTRARNPPSPGTHTRAQDPPWFSSGRPPCRCSTSAPWCRPRTPRPRPRRPPYICCRCSIVPRCRRGEFSCISACARGASGRVGRWNCSTSFCTARIAGRRGPVGRRKRRNW